MTSTQKKSKSSSIGNGGSKRGKNYSDEELVAYAKAYVAISADGSVGCDQDGDTFWERVHGEFVKLGFKERSATGLKKKFHGSKGFNATMSFMSNAVRRYKRAPLSGANLEDDIKLAQDLFAKKFKMQVNMEAWTIIKQLAKYSDDPGTYDAFISSKLTKRTSRDKAKQMKREVFNQESRSSKHRTHKLSDSPAHKDSGKRSAASIKLKKEDDAFLSEMRSLFKQERGMNEEAALADKLQGLTQSLNMMEKTWRQNPSFYPPAVQKLQRDSLNGQISRLLMQLEPSCAASTAAETAPSSVVTSVPQTSKSSPLLGRVQVQVDRDADFPDEVPDVPDDVPDVPDKPKTKSKSNVIDLESDSDSEEDDDEEEVKQLVQSGDEHDHGDVYEDPHEGYESSSSSSSEEEELDFKNMGMGKEKFIKMQEEQKKRNAAMKKQEKELKKKLSQEKELKKKLSQTSKVSHQASVPPEPKFPEIPAPQTPTKVSHQFPEIPAQLPAPQTPTMTQTQAESSQTQTQAAAAATSSQQATSSKHDLTDLPESSSSNAPSSPKSPLQKSRQLKLLEMAKPVVVQEKRVRVRQNYKSEPPKKKTKKAAPKNEKLTEPKTNKKKLTNEERKQAQAFLAGLQAVLEENGDKLSQAAIDALIKNINGYEEKLGLPLTKK